jgi:hypothetical protein
VFEPGSGQVGFMVDKVALGQVLFEYFRFPLPIFIPPNSPSSQSPGAGTIGHSVADVPSGPSMNSTPHYTNKKNATSRKVAGSSPNMVDFFRFT